MRQAVSPLTDDLPPPESGAEDGERDELADDEIGGLLPDAEPELPSEVDDELPTDPTVGIDLLSETGSGENEMPLDLPLGPDWTPDEDDADTDDALGLGGLDPDGSPSEPEQALTVELGDGFDDVTAVVDERELPLLDGDEPGVDFDDRSFGPALETADESTLPETPLPWRIDGVTPNRERCGALAIGRGAVVAGSSDLFWLDEGRKTPVRVGLDGTRISSLVLVGETRETALSVTAFGRLLRRTRLGGEVERLVDWRRVAEASGKSAESLELCQLGEAHPSSVLGRLTSGRLVRSDDQGSTFRAVDTDLTALTISSTGDPIVVLSRDGARLGLSFDGGHTWETLELASPALEIAGGEAPLLAAAGDVVALCEAERGLVVSGDRGRTFRRVGGCGNASACAAGTLDGRGVVWVALYREALDRTLLALVDVSTGEARTSAILSSPPSDDPDQGGELGRVERLAWDGERLWAAGGFGLAVIQR